MKKTLMVPSLNPFDTTSARHAEKSSRSILYFLSDLRVSAVSSDCSGSVDNRRSGFTLIELMVVIAILSVIATVSSGLVLLTFHADHNLSSGYRNIHNLAQLGERFRSDLHETPLSAVSINDKGQVLQLGPSLRYTVSNRNVIREQNASIEQFRVSNSSSDSSQGIFEIDNASSIVRLQWTIVSDQKPVNATEPQVASIIIEAHLQTTQEGGTP